MVTPTRGPCTAWDAILCCDLPAGSEAVSGTWVQVATEILYNLSGQIFDECSFTIRPCRSDCGDGWWGGGFGGINPGGGGWWEWGGGSFPRPFLFDGSWYNIVCGGCSGSCSCTQISEALLPSPVASITQVKLDGVILTAGVDYRVDDYRKLVRLGGQFWPYCQDMNLPDTDNNTWSVTAVIGEAVPQTGLAAAGELACELIRACLGLECRLPAGVTQIVRQGVTITLPTLSEMLEHGFVGLPLCDLFVTAYNPNRLKAPPRVYDVDRDDFGRRITWP